MPVYLLDTCAVIWIANGDPLREPAASALREAYATGGGLAVSPMTAWEIAMLAAKGRSPSQSPLRCGSTEFSRCRGLRSQSCRLPVLIASCALPDAPPADPVDRILAATARAFGYTLVTRDRHLLAYGEHGHVGVMAC